MKKIKIICLSIVIIISFAKLSLSEPFVVLEYKRNSNHGSFKSDNIFLRDLNYSTNHTVLKNETLTSGRQALPHAGHSSRKCYLSFVQKMGQ